MKRQSGENIESNNPRLQRETELSTEDLESQIPTIDLSQEGQGASGSVSASANAADNAHSRDAFDQESIKKSKKRKRHRTIRRVLLACLIVVVVAVLGLGAAAFAYMHDIDERLSEDLPEDLKDSLEPAEGPFYMLLLGTDGSADRESSEEFAGGSYRSDSLMLLRIDEKGKKVTTVSLHRDILVNLGDYGQQKLNAAFAFGGAPYAIQVVSKIAGVPISHYAQLDFDGFRDVVNALGGIEVDVPVEIDDDEAGGYLAPGLQTLDGDQALILCRSRHTYDEYGDGDSFRAANQRMVIAAIAKKILSSDITTMLTTVSTLVDYVKTDMNSTEILSLANNMRGINFDTDFYSGSTPTTSQYIGDGWYEILDETAWKKMMERVNQGLPPTEEEEIDPVTGIVLSGTGETALLESAEGGGDVGDGGGAAGAAAGDRSGTVAIRNATEIDGAAAGAAEIVGAMGYTVDTDNAASGVFPESVVVYGAPDQSEYAQEIADSLGINSVVLNDGEYLFDTNYLVVIGDDWQ